MTTPASWTEAYKVQKSRADLLKKEVDKFLAHAPSTWYTASRIKESESFYQKLETGRVKDFGALEDFFGALIVVPLSSDIPNAYRFLEEFFKTSWRRPEDDSRSKTRATDFPFSDVRLYGTLKPDETLPPSPLDEVVFEVQVKTFFQHAWSSATHDLVYKHHTFSWSRSRVAAQVKAMLDSAELSILALDRLDAVEGFSKTGEPESSLSEFLTVMRENWDESLLPSNTKRAVESVRALCIALDLPDAEHWANLLTTGKQHLGGHPDGWSPYQCTIEYASRSHPSQLIKLLKKGTKRPETPSVFHVTQGILDRLRVDLSDCPYARV